MRMLVLLLAFAVTATSAPDPSQLRIEARAAKSAGDYRAAAELYESAATAALAEADPRNAFHDLHQAGFAALSIDRNDHVVAIARRAIGLADDILPGLAGNEREAVHFCRLECRALLDRSLANLGRIAEGYSELRRLSREIGQYRVTEEGGASGDPRQAADLGSWSPKLRSLVWRATTREAEYLDIMGRTEEAITILRNASVQISALGRVADEENFYAAKISPALATIVDFLGYRRDAIEIRRAAISNQTVRLTGSSLWGSRINLLRSVAKYEGSSKAILDEAEECHRQLVRLSPTGRSTKTAVLIEKMRADYEANYDSAGNIRRLASELHRDGMRFDGIYGERDALVAAGDKPGLDGDYVRVLDAMRRQGNKRGEPIIYREYAGYLGRTGRPADALPIYREALRLAESFGWGLHSIRLRIEIIRTFCNLNDFASAGAEWDDLNRRAAKIADLPPDRALEIRVARVEWELLRGRRKEATAAFDEARKFADGQKINAWLRGSLDQLKLDADTNVPPVRAAVSLAPVALQPSRVETNAAPGDPLRARFALRNPGAKACSGEFRARGPAIQLGLGTAPRRITGSAAAGGVENELSIPIALAPGEDLAVVLDMKGAPAEGGASKWQISWHEGSSQTGAEWRVTTEHDPFVVSVLNANQLRRSSFHSLAFTHQIVRRARTPGLENIRFVASTPLRLEYYDATSRRLLAVDAEGNGTFTEPGDLLLADADSNLAPDVEFDGRERLREIEIVVFSAVSAPAPGRQTIIAERLVGDRWEEVARNDLE